MSKNRINSIKLICLVLGVGSEERGCLDDLFKLLNDANNDNGKTLNDGNGLANAPLNDQCHRLAPGNGMSLCKCTSNLCNSSRRQNYLTKSHLTLIVLCLHSFLRVFLS